MLKGSGGRKGQECAHSALKNHPLSFIGRGKILAQFLWPGMETRLRRATGQLEGFSTEGVDTDGNYVGRDGVLRNTILDRGRFGRDGLTVEGPVENLVIDQDLSTWSFLNLAVAGDLTSGQPDPHDTALGFTLEDDEAGDTPSIRSPTITIADDSEAHTAVIFIKKDSDTSRFPEIQLQMTGGTLKSNIVDFNTSTGATVVRNLTGTGSHIVESVGDFWMVALTLFNDGTGNTSMFLELVAAVGDVIGSVNAATLGTTDFSFPGIYKLEFVPLYIDTTGVAVTKDADDFRLDNTSEVICKAAQGSLILIATPGFEGNQIAGDDIIVYDTRDAGNNNGFRLFYRKTDGDLAVEMKSGGPPVANLAGGGVGAVRGKTQVVALTWDTDDYRFYNKAILLDSDNLGDAPLSVNAEFFVGEDMTTGRQMKGQLGCVVITEPSLTTRQVENATAVMGKTA